MTTLSSQESGPPGHVVVVGAGLGGVRTIERLRRRGYEGQITLLGAEQHLPYDRPPLSKQVLRGDHVEPHWLGTVEQLEALQVAVRLNTPATGLAVDEHQVRIQGGAISYDVAVIATGAVPRRLPGINGRVLRTLDDTRLLQRELVPGSRLVVIGAGLVGCEVAASARAMGLEVALVDVLAAPAVRVLGPEVGELLAEVHRSRGVEQYFGRSVAAAEPGKVTLDDGTVLQADVVLEAIGARPDVDWLADSGVSLHDGVTCNADGLAAHGVYAVGDVANWAGRRHEHWTNVGQQADHVAASVLGQDIPPVEVSYWWSDQYDIKVQGLGETGADDRVDVVTWGPKARTVAVYSDNGHLTGLVGFSAPGAIMRLRDDIVTGTPVDQILARLTA